MTECGTYNGVARSCEAMEARHNLKCEAKRQCYPMSAGLLRQLQLQPTQQMLHTNPPEQETRPSTMKKARVGCGMCSDTFNLPNEVSYWLTI